MAACWSPVWCWGQGRPAAVTCLACFCAYYSGRRAPIVCINNRARPSYLILHHHVVERCRLLAPRRILGAVRAIKDVCDDPSSTYTTNLRVAARAARRLFLERVDR